MRWLHHLRPRGGPIGVDLAPDSLAREGFVHCSHLPDVRESARLYFRPEEELEVVRIDPRRLGASRLELAPTPRGPMPHVHGPIPADAIAAVHDLAGIGGAPDRVTGTRFGFVGFAGMTLLDLVGMLDPIGRIASMGFDPTSTCEVVGASENAVWSGAGATFSVTRVRPPLDAFDVLLVPGGYGTRGLERDATFVAWLASYPSNRLVASVCTGALLLGAAGMLRGRRATTHHVEMHRLVEHGAVAVPERVVDEGRVITAGGVTSALDLGLHVVRRLEGDDVADRIRAQMEMPPARD